MDKKKKQIFAIIGSIKKDSSNKAVVNFLKNLYQEEFDFEIFEGLAALPHFNPDLDNENIPDQVRSFREKVEHADGVIICTPEYIFSLPGALKNAIEWTVSTTVFSQKPVALITASASGEMAHQSLMMIMKTLYTKFDSSATLLIKGIKGKVNKNGDIHDEATIRALRQLANSFKAVFNT